MSGHITQLKTLKFSVEDTEGVRRTLVLPDALCHCIAQIILTNANTDGVYLQQEELNCAAPHNLLIKEGVRIDHIPRLLHAYESEDGEGKVFAGWRNGMIVVIDQTVYYVYKTKTRIVIGLNGVVPEEEETNDCDD